MNRKRILKISTREIKWEYRFYRSCAPLKIMIYLGEFVDALTPLNCFQFGVSISANVLLMTGHN